jgi:hypothetical protein
MGWLFFGRSGQSRQGKKNKSQRRRLGFTRGRRSVFEELEARRVLAVLTVNSLTDTSVAADGLVTLREAIIASNTDTATDLGETGQDADTIQFAPGLNGTITLAGGVQLSITDAVTITGPGLGSLTIDGVGASRIFNITEEVGDVTLSGMTLTGGNPGVGNGGGAIFSKQFGTLSISNSAITGNNSAFGGGMYVAGDVDLNNVTIGGIGALANTAVNGGGGIFNYGNVTLTNSIISGNEAQNGDGGGILSYGNLTAVNSTIGGDAAGAGNTANGKGGGVYAVAVNLTSSTITGNTATTGPGGGLYAAGAVEITSSTVSGNTATAGAGGGVYGKGAVSIENSTIGGISAAAANKSGGNGGGILGLGTISVLNSTFALNEANAATADGGGIFGAGAITLRNSTVSGNKANDNGGGIFGVNVTLQNSTVASNTADSDNSGGAAGDGLGGGVYAATKFKTVNSIIVGNSDTNNGNPDLKIPAGGSSSARFSLIGDNTGLPAGAQFAVTGPTMQQATTGNIIGQPGGSMAIAIGDVLDPLGLKDNSGPTPTIALLTGSIAVNKGQNSLVVSPATGDQRNLPFGRISPLGGRVDMGAFELQTATPGNTDPALANAIADQSTVVDSLFVFQFPANTFTDANGDPLTYTATLVGGAPLPAWLTFNSVSRSFTGTPTAADIGVLNVRVTASDGKGGTNPTDDFTLTVTGNPPPVVSNAIPDQHATVGLPFSFTVAANTFTDPGGDPLAYTATLAGGGALPAWLTFDPVTRTFGGTPAAGDVGTLAVRVTATDTSGGSISDDFNLDVSTSELPFNENFEGPIDTRFQVQTPSFATTTNALTGLTSWQATRTNVGDRPVATVNFSNATTAANVSTVTANVSPGGGNGSSLWSNAVIVFDYVDANNYKYAGVFEIIDQLVIGQVVNGVRQPLQRQAFPTAANDNVPLTLSINRTTKAVTLTSAATSVAYTFASIGNGTVGVGTINANARFDSLQVS